MRFERVARPAGQRLIAVVVHAVCAEVEAELTPGDELVQPGLGRRAHAPPAFASATRFPESLRAPLLAQCKSREDFVRADVAEVQIGREPAGAVDLRLVAIVRVSIEAPVEEGLQAPQRCYAPAG